MEEALLRNDAANQEGDEQDDRHRLPADPVELMDGRCQAEAGGARDDGSQRTAKRAEHVDERHQPVAEGLGFAAQPVEPEQDAEPPSRLGRARSIGLAHFIQQVLIGGGQPGDVGVLALAAPGAQKPLKQPGAEGVEFTDRAHVDRHAGGPGGGSGLRLDQRLQGIGKRGRP